MPSTLQRRQQVLKHQRYLQRHRAPRAGDPFVEKASIPGHVPLDAWGGWAGEGWGFKNSLFVTTGTREGGTGSRVLRLDEDAATWADDGAPTGAETLNKIRNGHVPGGPDKLWVFYETPPEGQRYLIAREAAGTWAFQSVPDATDEVGGRGLGINGASGERVIVGAGHDTGRVSELQADGSWSERRAIENSLMWEIEFDGEGRVWEFWNEYGSRQGSHVFVNGDDRGESPGMDISSACWFKGNMYTVGPALGSSTSQGTRNRIHRSSTGSDWVQVHQFAQAQKGDHVLVIPRGEGELWVVGHDPLEVAYSTDGTTWTREFSLPAFATGADNNHMTAIAFWLGGVWLFARDSGHSTCRVFSDGGSGNGGSLGEGGLAGAQGNFPVLNLPPKPPELPLVPPPTTSAKYHTVPTRINFNPVPTGTSFDPSTRAGGGMVTNALSPMGQSILGSGNAQQDPVAKAVTDGYERNDAFQTRWTDDITRVVKDSWGKLDTFTKALVDRVAILEKRISDTYTWGQGGLTVDKPIALPLRVVRDEELVEMTIAAETASEEGAISIELTLDAAPLLTGTLAAGQNFVVIPASGSADPELPGLPLKKDQKLSPITRVPGKKVKGVVVQARCR